MTSTKRAVCVVSGGIDSVSSAAIIGKVKEYDLYFISFVYGQRGQKEIQISKDFAFLLNAMQHKVIDIGFMKSLYGESNALTDDRKTMPEVFDRSVLVPMRNSIFLGIASAWAYSIRSPLVIYGSHTGDFNYPDCRPEFIRHLTTSFNLGETDSIQTGWRDELKIWSPAIDGMSKIDVIKRGHVLLGDSIFKTWSCYLNEEKQCGRCESCRNRKQAIKDAGLTDKTEYKI